MPALPNAQPPREISKTQKIKTVVHKALHIGDTYFPSRGDGPLVQKGGWTSCRFGRIATSSVSYATPCGLINRNGHNLPPWKKHDASAKLQVGSWLDGWGDGRMNLVGEERGRRMLLCHDMMNGRL